ncbi:unnamed protein product [Leuciscus chuanchicus]
MDKAQVRNPKNATASGAAHALTLVTSQPQDVGEKYATGRGSKSPPGPPLSTKRPVFLATWNIRTGYAVGQREQVAQELAKYNVAIVAITELRLTDFGNMSVAVSLISERTSSSISPAGLNMWKCAHHQSADPSRITGETLALIEQRKKNKLDIQDEYRRLHKIIRKRLKKERAAYWEELAEEMETAANHKEFRTLYSTIRRLAGKNKPLVRRQIQTQLRT